MTSKPLTLEPHACYSKRDALAMQIGAWKKWLLFVHASHLDHPLSPYQAWQGSVLCPHLLEWGRSFSSSQNSLRTWKWSYSQAGTGRESTKNPQREFTHHVHFIWLYASHQARADSSWCPSFKDDSYTHRQDLELPHLTVLPDTPYIRLIQHC